jgi:hypothetical protein
MRPEAEAQVAVMLILVSAAPRNSAAKPMDQGAGVLF